MNYASIKQFDSANGPGIRISIFVCGCPHHCKGCFNQEALDFDYGEPFTDEVIETVIEYLKPDYICGLTVLGGEPMFPANQAEVVRLLRRVREVYGNSKSIWVYTGYLFDNDILGCMLDKVPATKELLSYVDVIMDGPFVEEQHNLNAYFRGSDNQRAILVQETLANDNKELVLWQPQEPQYVYPNK